MAKTEKLPRAKEANNYRRNNEKRNDAYRQENLSVTPLGVMETRYCQELVNKTVTTQYGFKLSSASLSKIGRGGEI